MATEAATSTGSRTFLLRLAAIVAFAVALRAVHTLLIAPWPPGIFGDELYYRSLAGLIREGEGFIRPAEYLTQGVRIPTAERAPLFSLTLAVIGKLGATGADAQRLFGALTGGGTVLMVGLLARRLAGDRAGLIAAGIGALYPVLISADAALMTESMYGFLATSSLVLAYRLLDAPGARRALALGAVVALASLARGEGLILLPLLLVPFVRMGRDGWRAAALACVAFALVLAPWAIRNYSVFDRPVPVATEGGETLAGANCDETYYGPRPGTWSAECAAFEPGDNEAEALDKLGHEGVRYAVDHAGRVPAILAIRFARTWGVREPFQVPEGRRRWVMNTGAVIFFVLLPLAVYGFVLLRRRRVPVWIAVTPFMTVTITTLITYGSIRFRHSAEPALVTLAAVGVDRVWARVRSPGGG
ncbi:MAG: glycosyltransferase family 39 protein [Thermoleophilaceae bacterium]|nr:glycosyltransferase family 39 protein [Thermoleophilaceae bacterium]